VLAPGTPPVLAVNPQPNVVRQSAAIGEPIRAQESLRYDRMTDLRRSCANRRIATHGRIHDRYGSVHVVATERTRCSGSGACGPDEIAGMSCAPKGTVHKEGQMTQRMPIAEARKGFASMLRNSAAGERIKLTRYNKTVAVIIPKKDLAELEDCEKRKSHTRNGEHDHEDQSAHSAKPAKSNK
jgi:antitoxin (DNA-binding transcriptional repressor) of toxin-antitoxin stability system